MTRSKVMTKTSISITKLFNFIKQNQLKSANFNYRIMQICPIQRKEFLTIFFELSAYPIVVLKILILSDMII